ncbi:NAD(P)/FAD-dependent oxidoreductase [Haloquadratum walsbyi]|jgi:UDP-galactopyranose mutase (EC 5.4.99.9)|uniref:Phytoene dehydrogenase related protein n=1 Tax=Haloquadratum walsbyi J07HQW2 TaxID=1238425 RepID=U1PS13_9EURY|nr:NAD(P)/FAD-dependent oxidoreductase [Haloquadratum walsbyi]ERG96572.1 MAG: Phytoene dehydrogenase related protein [Haloquadratum walsbyi J07HQW2]
MSTDSVVVVGAGLAGLVAARHLAQAGADVTVYEQRSEVGGRVRTRHQDGFIIDRGFQVLFTSYPAVKRELDADALSLRRFTPGAVIARPGSRSVLSDPLRDPRAAISSLRTDEVTQTDKIRTLLLRQHVGTRTEQEIFNSPDQSIRSYLQEWGFSDDYLDHFIAPFYGGITLDRSLSTSKRVFEYTFKSLSTGEIALPADGIQAVPQQLSAHARDAGATVVCEEGVNDIIDYSDGVTVETETTTVDADAVVIATDPADAQQLTGVDSIPTNTRGCVTQYYELPATDAPETRQKIILNAADPTPNTVVPLSNIASEYAPDGKALLNATFLSTAAFDHDADSLAEQTRSALSSWYPDRDFDSLKPITTDRIEFAQFDQPPGVHDNLPQARAPGGRTYLAGDYTAWSGIQGAMRSGREAAVAVTDDR